MELKITSTALAKKTLNKIQLKVQPRLPGHDSSVLVSSLHGVSLAAPSHSVGEQQSILALEQIIDQGQTNLVEDVALAGFLIEHI